MTEIVYIAGAFLSLFLVVLILSKKKKHHYDFVLSVWLFLLAIHISIFYLEEKDYTFASNVFIVNATFPLIQGVFLFLYAGLQLQRIQIKWITGLHFLPFVLLALAAIIIGQQLIPVIVFCGFASSFSYCIMTYYLLGGFKQKENQQAHWLKLLTGGLTGIWFLFIVIGSVNHLLGWDFLKHEYLFLAVNLFVFIIGYFGLKDGYILSVPQNRTKYGSSALSKTDFERIGKRLDELAELEKYYLNSNLKITDLAHQVQVPNHHLSQYFSLSLNTTYYDFINTLRVNEVKERIAKGELKQLSLLGLAYDCGFKSKATFNRVFKKLSGQTPTEYINALK